MAKTEVILTHNIVGLGGESDQVKVAAGYARNYLFPQGLAIPVTQANKRRLESLRQRRAEREAHEFNTMNDDGKMFGAVTAGTIADQLKTQFDITLDKKKIHLEHPLKTLGEHEVELHLHTEVKTSMKVRIESENPLPVAEAAPAKDGEKKITEKRGRRPEGKAEEAKPEGKAKRAEKK
jgi:large subunit ribosomal protein L9